MRCTRIPVLLSVALLSLLQANTPAWAQEVGNEAIAAAKKAALIIEGKGTAPIKPNTFYVKVGISSEKTGRAATQAEYQRSMDTLRNALEKAGFRSGEPTMTELLRRIGDASFTGVTGPESQDPPNASFRIVGYFTFSVATPAKAKEAFAALRATGVSGNVELHHYITDEEAARRAALKVAVAQAKQRVQILSEAAKPKEFDLVFVREGEFQISSATTGASLQGNEPLRTMDTISAEANVILFYGLKPVTVAATPKTVAIKTPAKPTKKP